PALAVKPVGDAMSTQRMPDRRHIDRDERLAELMLERREDGERREIRAGLHDGVDIVAVELADDRVDHLLRRGVRDRCRGVAFEPDDLGDLIARFLEEAMDLRIAV